MRLSLLFVWTTWALTLHSAAQHPPDREEGGVLPGHRVQRRRHSSGRQPRLDARKPVTVKGAGEKLGGKRAPLKGPHVCGDRCCVGWTLMPKTRRCTKPRCVPRCHGSAVCRQSNRCVCPRGFTGHRCEVSTVTIVLPEQTLTSVKPTWTPKTNPKPPSSRQEPESEHKPAQRKMRVLSIRSGPTTLFPTPETQIPDSGHVKPGNTEDGGSIAEMFVIHESQASPNHPQVERWAERREEVAPEIHNLHRETGDLKKTEETTALHGYETEPKDSFISETQKRLSESPNLDSLSRSESEEKAQLDLKHLKSKGQKLMQQSKMIERSTTLKPEGNEGLNVKTDSVSNAEDRVNEGFNSQPSKESNPGMKAEKSVDVGVNEKEKKREEDTVEPEENKMEDDRVKPEETKMEEHGAKPEEKKMEDDRAKPEENKMEDHGAKPEENKMEEDRVKPEEKKMEEHGAKPEEKKMVDDRAKPEEKKNEDHGAKPEEKKMEDDGAKPEEKKMDEEVKTRGAKKLSLSLREAQAVLMKKTLLRGGDKMAALLMKHVEKERKKLHAVNLNQSSSSSGKTSMKTIYTQKGQYTIYFTAPAADGQTVTGGGGAGGGAERIQVMFTPTICKVRCSQGRCVNYCERGNVTTLFTSTDGGRRDSSHGPGFRVSLCPLLCKNGGICLQKDRCLCPPNFTGKFCQISVTPTAVASVASPPSITNEIVKPAQLSAVAANQDLTHSEFLLPLGQTQETRTSGAPSPSMVTVRVQHPPEASVKIHQVLKVSGYSPNLQALTSSSTSGTAGAPAPASRGIQAQTVRGGGTYTQQSGFKYCFREVKNGQCSSPLPGLRSREMCCKGIGKAWGITECVLCPENTDVSNSTCPAGFERGNSTGCVDINECLQPGLCENGLCVNTRGSYSCVCRAGFILDASHGICISHKVISEEKGQCHRILGPGQGPSSCSLPILKNITKQICCCSRVGKAWGPDCQRCPYFGSAAFKEICPAGPGYQYSSSALQFNQRVNEHLGSRGAPLVTSTNQDNQGTGSEASRTAQNPSSSGSSTSLSSASSVGSAGSSSSHTRPALPLPQPQPYPQPPSRTFDSSRLIQPSSSDSTASQGRPPVPGRPGTQETRPDAAQSFTVQQRPQPPSSGGQGGRFSAASRPNQPTTREDSNPALAKPQSPEPGSRPRVGLPSLQNRPAGTTTTTPPARVQSVRGVCESRPGVCVRGRCVDQPGGKYTCVCDQGYQLNPQRTFCQDMNECLQNPCRNSLCENTPGSFRCVCRLGYRLVGNTCTDVDECGDPLQCPGQECINSQGSYRCVSCQPGYGLLNGLCTDIDECRGAPCSNGRCENTHGSFRCICRHGFKLQNNTCADIDECGEPSQCPGQMCVNSVGSYRCTSCKPGYKLINRQCADVNECEDRDSCPNQQCVNTEGSYRCVNCQQGYHSVNGLCTDVDECLLESRCPGQRCVNTMGSYRCVSCQSGYSFKHGSCQDIDECENIGVCEAERVCVNTVGSFRCNCAPGYRSSGLGRACRDVNECLEEDFCFPRGECLNTPGSYTCVCSQGFTLSDNRTSCIDVDECLKSGVCLDGRCVNTEGSFQCQCKTGFTSNPEKTTCLDVDECVSSGGAVCGSERCENTIGSYRCITSCEPGYKIAETGRCTDDDECANKTVCGDHAKCQNLIGTYMCICDEGYTSSAKGKPCVDVDECVSQPGVCGSARCENLEGSFKCVCDRPGQKFVSTGRKCVDTVGTDAHECVKSGVCFGGQCVNIGGSFQCQCQTGFTSNPEKTACRDVDECALSGHSLCGSNRCENTIGSYQCITSCEPGYQLSPSGRCVDINECANQTVCGEHAFCQNLVGTHVCVCDQGFISNADGKACLDVDECESLPGVCGSARCENVEGSFMCECDGQGYEFDPTSRRCINTAQTGLPGTSSSSSSSSTSASSSSSSSSSVHSSVIELAPGLPPLPAARPGELRECYYNLAERGTCSLLATNTSQQECCCTVGEGWGLGCQYHTCPATNTAEFLSLCPSGKGYVTAGPGAFSYSDVDECKRFYPEVCKNGICVNNIPGYNCYCASGYVYNSTLLECVDHDECEEESCVRGICVNTIGSYYCSCPPPLVLDDTQRNCVNSSHLTIDENLSVCWQQVTADLICQSPLLGGQVTFMDCCCLYGEGWGMECALCPSSDSADYASLCSSFPPLLPEGFPDPSGPDTGVRPGGVSPGGARRGGSGAGGGGGGGVSPPYFPPYSPDSFPPAVIPGRDFGAPDYDDYSPAGGSRSGFRGRTSTTFSLPDGAYGRPEYGGGYYPEGDFSRSDGSQPRPPSFHLPLDPRTEGAFRARPPPPSGADGAPLSLAPLPGAPYQEQEEEEEEAWRPSPPFPPFNDRSRGGGAGGGAGGGGGRGVPRRVYERRYESYAGLSTAEDCGILHGCDNGRCIRVAEGYTCDCYQGYELDMTSMTCIDRNECEDGASVEFPCVNARCVNTEGSFRCVCRRGYVMSRRPNHCVAA